MERTVILPLCYDEVSQSRSLLHCNRRLIIITCWGEVVYHWTSIQSTRRPQPFYYLPHKIFRYNRDFNASEFIFKGQNIYVHWCPLNRGVIPLSISEFWQAIFSLGEDMVLNTTITTPIFGIIRIEATLVYTSMLILVGNWELPPFFLISGDTSWLLNG